MPLPAAGANPTAAMLRLLLGGLFDTVAGFAEVLTSESTTNTSFVNLATVGPTVTLTSTGTKALLLWSAATSNNTQGQTAVCTYEVSGATSISAADDNGLKGDDGRFFASESAQFALVTINPGSNTYRLKYRATGNTASFFRRRLLVIAP